MKALHAHIQVIGIVAGFSWLNCSLPHEIEPAKWQMHVEVPVIDTNIVIGEVLPAGSYSGLDVAFGDSTAAGDTLSVSKTDSVRFCLERELQTVDTFFMGKKLGVGKLNHLPLFECVFALHTGLSDVKKCNVPVSAPRTLSLSKKMALTGVHSLTIDENSPPMNVTVANMSRSADIEDVAVALMDNQEVLGIFHTASLSAQLSKNVSLSLAGKCLRSPVSVTVCISFCKNAVLHPEDRFSVSFSLNNQGVSEAVIVDSLLDHADVFFGNIGIADSLRLDEIEIDTMSLPCEITCPALLKMEVAGSIVSNLSPCHTSLTDGYEDTGRVEALITDTLFRTPGTVFGSMRLPFHSKQIFPSWNPRLGQSFVRCRFSVRSLPDGRVIKFNKNDMFMIKLVQPRLPIVRIGGCFTKKITHSLTTKMKVGTGIHSAIGDSLQRALYFTSARLHLDFSSGLPAGCSIDSLLVRIAMKNENSIKDSAVVVQKLVNLLPGSRHVATVDFTGLFNSWPDTLAFSTQLVLPPSCGVKVYNPNTRDNGSKAFALKINPSLVWKLTVPLCWTNDDTTRIELERTSLSLTSAQLAWILKLEEPRVRIMLTMLNKTHLNVSLFAFGAPGRYKDELMSIPADSVQDECVRNSHLFSLLGPDGVRLEPSDTEQTTVVTLDIRGIEALLSQDSCALRWFLTIPTRKIGALLSHDFCTLKATGQIDGIGRTDSLLAFE